MVTLQYGSFDPVRCPACGSVIAEHECTFGDGPRHD